MATMTKMTKLRVFIDADVLFAAAASPSTHSASTVILTLGEITLVECFTSQQAIVEGERNLTKKMPARLPEFRLLVARCLQVVDDPLRSDLLAFHGWADPKDLPLLVAAYREGCEYFLTFNTRHYYPKAEDVQILRPGDFLAHVRMRLIGLG